MAFKRIKAKDLRRGDMLMHESVIGFIVLDIAKHHDQVVLLIRSGKTEETLSLYTNQLVDIER